MNKHQQQKNSHSQVIVQTKTKQPAQSLDQQRAKFVWGKIHHLPKDKTFDAYTKLSKGAGTLIMQNGLMPTLAFYGQKTKGAFSRAGGNEHAALLDDILAWLNQQNLITKTDFSSAMSEICQKSSPDYRQITEETLAVIRWIRHFASALNVGNTQAGE